MEFVANVWFDGDSRSHDFKNSTEMGMVREHFVGIFQLQKLDLYKVDKAVFTAVERGVTQPDVAREDNSKCMTADELTEGKSYFIGVGVRRGEPTRVTSPKLAQTRS